MQATAHLDLARLDKLYARFQRSLRALRALAGAGLSGLFLLPLFALALPFEMTVSMGVFTLFLVFIWLDWYMATAATDRFVLVLNTLLIAIWIALRAFIAIYIAFFQLDETGLRLLVLLGILINAIILGSMIGGIAELGTKAPEEVRALFRTDAEKRGFLRGPRQVIRDFCRAGGLAVPPGKLRQPLSAILAVLLACALEGGAYYQYLKLGYGVTQRHQEYDLLAEAWGLVGANLFVLAVSLFGLLLCYLCLIAGRKLRAWAQRKALVPLADARATDPRPPVLFLRSFRDDSVTLSAAPVPWYMRFFDPGVTAGNLEELIMRVFTPIGPVVALGRPGDSLPPPGAARAYASDDTWQTSVTRLIDDSATIVLALESGEGIAFELSQLRARAALVRTIIVVPPALALDHDQVATLSGNRLTTITPASAIVAIIFDSRNSPIVLHATVFSELTYELALRFSFRPREDLPALVEFSSLPPKQALTP